MGSTGRYGPGTASCTARRWPDSGFVPNGSGSDRSRTRWKFSGSCCRGRMRNRNVLPPEPAKPGADMIEFYGGYEVYSESGVDLTLLRRNLQLSLEERLRNNGRMLPLMDALRKSGQRGR